MTLTIDSAKSKVIGEQLLKHIFCYRRLSSNRGCCAQEPCRMCLAPHLPKIEFFIKQKKPIHFILPAFPAKSSNKQKVLGPLPDMGERISLQFLQSLCDRIRDIYAPGAQITICSDGRVFSDLVCVKDEDVTAYGREIKNILDDINADAIDVFNLEDLFGELSFDEMRQKLILNYAESIETIRFQVKNDPDKRNLFNGIHRFLFEDYLVLQPFKSRNKIQTESKKSAYGVIQRSNAWSVAIAEKFPQALRFSIHPQPYHSEKIGIYTIETKDAWGTPWHNVAVYDGKKFLLMKRSQAESMRASLVWHNDRPSHFVLSNTLISPLN
ncbi:MAG: isocyanide synthase family protein [Prochloraceae cyanobacterium]|nr:isocyanide synthase family protein [Prochloraceae cyanobacterium]